MEQINIYEGEQVISRILVQEGVEGLEECLEQYEHVYAVMDENVAMKCYAAGTIADEKGTLLHCSWECKLVQPLWTTVWRFLKSLEIELPSDQIRSDHSLSRVRLFATP